MAKLKAPLMSLGASGKLGDALVFFPWKGLDVVREYVIPTNPRSALQTIQRAFLAAAVAAIHAAQALAANPLNEADQTAMALLGSTRQTPRTWFNEIVKQWLDVEVAANIPIVYSNGLCTDPTATGIDMKMYINEETGSTLAAGKFFFGKTKTNLIHSYAATVNVSNYVALTNTGMSSWMAVGDKIFWQFRPDVADGCEGADSGIYHFVAT